MAQEVEQERPLGVVLLAVFWILLSIPLFFLSSYMRYNEFVVLFFTLFGTLFILVGWGLLIFSKYAFYISFVLCLLGLLPLILLLPSVISAIAYGYFYLAGFFPFLFFLVFLPILVYQIKVRKLYIS